MIRSGAKKKDVALVRVSGAFEIPLAARTLAETGKYDAILCIGCLQQAIDRAGLKMGNKGFEAALAAVEMANLKTAVSRQPSAVSKSKAKPTSRKRKVRS